MNSTVPIPSMGSPSGNHKLITLTSAGRARAQHRQKTAKGFPLKAGRSTSGGCHTSFEVSKEVWSGHGELMPCTPASSSWGDVVAIESRNPCPGLMDCICRCQVAAGGIQDRDCCPFVHTNIPPPAGGLDTALPIPDVHELFWSFVGAFVSIMAISLLNHFAGVEEQIVYLVGSFGASAVLLFAVTESKLAQPRNVRKMCAVVVGRKGGMPVPRRGIACSPGLLGWEWVCGCRPCMTSSHCGPMSARRLPQAPAPS